VTAGIRLLLFRFPFDDCIRHSEYKFFRVIFFPRDGTTIACVSIAGNMSVQKIIDETEKISLEESQNAAAAVVNSDSDSDADLFGEDAAADSGSDISIVDLLGEEDFVIKDESAYKANQYKREMRAKKIIIKLGLKKVGVHSYTE